MSISVHSNGIASTIEFKCNREKQYKHLSNHHFLLCLTQKTKHRSGDPLHAALKWYSINFQWVFGVHIIRDEGEIINKALGNSESALAGIREKIFTKIEAYAGMAKRLVIGIISY